MTTAKKLLTADDLLAMPDDGKWYELVRGELIEMPPPSFMHMVVTGNIGWLMATFNRQNNLGFVDGPEAAAYIERGPDTVRAADYALIARDRIPDPPPRRGYVFGLIPDLVVEVVSPGNSVAEAQRRARMWLDAGVRLVLTAYVQTSEIHAHHDDGAVYVFGIADTLTCEPVLPGFSCPIADIFTY